MKGYFGSAIIDDRDAYVPECNSETPSMIAARAANAEYERRLAATRRDVPQFTGDYFDALAMVAHESRGWQLAKRFVDAWLANAPEVKP